MGISLRGTIPDSCTPVNKDILFRMFDAKCHDTLKTCTDSPGSPNPFRKFSARSSRKTDYMEFESALKVPICDADNLVKPYAKKHFLLRMKTKKALKCPWENSPFHVRFEAQYSESLNPTFPVLSPWLTRIVPWPDNQSSISVTLVPDSIGDPFGLGSTGIGSANMTLYLEDSDPTDVCTPPSVNSFAHLNTLGLPIQWLAGPPIDQWKSSSHGCVDFEHGGSPIDHYWTGAYFYFGPLGVVMNLFIRVWGMWTL